MAQRIDWIDALKGFAIITVVIGHCATDCMSSGNYPAYKSLINAIYSSIYSFHMPLFFTISGYVFYLSKSYEKYKLKVLDFTIIYVIWSFFMWLSKFVMGSRINNPVTIEDLFKIIYQPIMVYWYLYVLIIFYLLFSIFKIAKIDKDLVLVMATVAIISRCLNLEIGVLNKMLYHMYFWVLGGYIASSNFLFTLSKSKIVMCLAFCFVNIVLYFQHFALLNMVAVLKSTLLATVATILLFIAFNRNLYGFNNALKIFGKNVLAIYVVHCFITGGLRVAFKLLQIDNVYLYFVIGTILGIAIPILMIKVCSTNGYLSLLFSPVNSLRKLGVVKA